MNNTPLTALGTSSTKVERVSLEPSAMKEAEDFNTSSAWASFFGVPKEMNAFESIEKKNILNSLEYKAPTINDLFLDNDAFPIKDESMMVPFTIHEESQSQHLLEKVCDKLEKAIPLTLLKKKQEENPYALIPESLISQIPIKTYDEKNILNQGDHLLSSHALPSDPKIKLENPFAPFQESSTLKNIPKELQGNAQEISLTPMDKINQQMQKVSEATPKPVSLMPLQTVAPPLIVQPSLKQDALKILPPTFEAKDFLTFEDSLETIKEGAPSQELQKSDQNKTDTDDIVFKHEEQMTTEKEATTFSRSSPQLFDKVIEIDQKPLPKSAAIDPLQPKTMSATFTPISQADAENSPVVLASITEMSAPTPHKPGSLKVALSPADLGKIDIAVTITEEGIRAVVQTEKSETFHLLTKDSAGLQKLIGEALGKEVESFDLSMDMQHNTKEQGKNHADQEAYHAYLQEAAEERRAGQTDSHVNNQIEKEMISNPQRSRSHILSQHIDKWI